MLVEPINAYCPVWAVNCATVLRFPTPGYIYILISLLMLTAFYRGMRGWEVDRENEPWTKHALGNGSGFWMMIFTLSLVLLVPLLIPKGVISASWGETGMALFLIGLVIASLLCAIFSRLLGVWMGFRWRQSIE